MNNASEPSFQEPSMQVPPARGAGQGGAGQHGAGQHGAGQHGAGGRARVRGQALPAGGPPVAGSGVLKAMSPGVVDFLFRKLVAGESAEDFQWHTEGVALAEQPPGAELARRLAGTDLDALTPTELFHYVRAVQRLAAWAEALREEAVGRYCSPGQGEAACPP